MKKLLLAVSLCILLAVPCSAFDAYIALTFDDGPTGEYTSQMLEVLQEADVRATFFLCGYRVEQYPLLTERIADAGHEIGLHGYSHRYFTDMTEAELKEELRGESYLIAEITGSAPTLLRPPGGLMLKGSSEIEAQFPLILWSVDPQDWTGAQSNTIVRRVTNSVRAGDVILLHDAGKHSAQAVAELIRILKARGFTFVTVSELAGKYGTPLCGGVRYYRFFENSCP